MLLENFVSINFCESPKVNCKNIQQFDLKTYFFIIKAQIETATGNSYLKLIFANITFANLKHFSA